MRRLLATRLPEPHGASAVVTLDGLPRTAQRQGGPAGPAAPRKARPKLPLSGSRPPVEEQLVEICAEVLGCERVGMGDNFFSLGGHSLLATQFVARLRERHGLDVPLQELFDAADFRDLADRIVERELTAKMGDLSPEELRTLLALDGAEATG